MAETLGKQGVVVDVLTTSGDVQVRFAGKNTHQFNPRVRVRHFMS